MKLEPYEEAIAAAKLVLEIEDGEFEKLSSQQNHNVVQQIEDEFVEGHGWIWWWEHLRQTDFVATRVNDAGWSNELMPEDTERVWFVMEPWGEKKQFSVYDVLAKYIEPVLKECPYFEYYVVAKNLTWLISENHHGYFSFVGEPVVVCIQRLVEQKPEQWQTSF